MGRDCTRTDRQNADPAVIARSPGGVTVAERARLGGDPRPEVRWTQHLGRRAKAEHGPYLWFQQMDAPRPQRNRMHLDVYVPAEVVEARLNAALAAGGRLVDDSHAPSFWVLVDPEGNEACLATAGWTGPLPVAG